MIRGCGTDLTRSHVHYLGYSLLSTIVLSYLFMVTRYMMQKILAIFYLAFLEMQADTCWMNYNLVEVFTPI